MSDELRKDAETEVEGHWRKPHGATEEPAGEGEVEGHWRKPHGATEEPAGEGETEVEAHVARFANVRMDSPSNT
jgi:hypothetical protein